MVCAVVVAGICVDLLRLRAQCVIPVAQGVVEVDVVALDVGLCRVDLRQRGIVHQVGQLALVLELAPAVGDAVGSRAGLVLVGVHGLHQVVVPDQLRQLLAVQVDHLAPADGLQAQGAVVR